MKNVKTRDGYGAMETRMQERQDEAMKRAELRVRQDLEDRATGVKFIGALIKTVVKIAYHSLVVAAVIKYLAT